MEQEDNLSIEGTLPIDLDKILDDAWDESNILSQETEEHDSETRYLGSINSSSRLSIKPSLLQETLSQKNILEKQESSLGDILEDQEFAQALFAPMQQMLDFRLQKLTEKDKNQQNNYFEDISNPSNLPTKAPNQLHESEVKDFDDNNLGDTLQKEKESKQVEELEEVSDPFTKIPRYFTLKDFIESRPESLEDKMLLFLSAWAHAISIPIPSFQPYTQLINYDIKIESVPLIGELINKHGFEVAIGFAKVATKNVFRAIPGVGIAITASQIYDIYNKLVSTPILLKDEESHKIKQLDPAVETDLDDHSSSLNTLSEYDLLRKFVRLSSDVPIPFIIEDISSSIIGIYKQDISNTGLRQCMIDSARSSVTYEMCSELRSLPNQLLAQKLVDIACCVEIHPIFLRKLPHIIGTYKHTHLKQVNEVYTVLCDDHRFITETYFDFEGVVFESKGKHPGSTKGMIRVDLRTLEKNIRNENLFEVYDLKTGIQGITALQIKKHIKILPESILYEVRPGSSIPKRKYHPVTGIDLN